MNPLDYTIIGIFIVSVILGVMRGAIYEILSVLGWPLAFFASKYLAPQCAEFLPISTTLPRASLAYVVVFIAALLVWAVLVWLLCHFVKLIGLGAIDSTLGAMFGLLRGALLVLAMIWGLGMTNVPEHRLWREARFSKTAEEVAVQTKDWLPDNVAQRIQYHHSSARNSAKNAVKK
jgi:membrane protein required for colicin V production